MKMKTKELEGAALDWAIGVAMSRDDVVAAVDHCCIPIPQGGGFEKYIRYSPSTDWSQGGPLLESCPWALPQKSPGHVRHLGAFISYTPGGLPHNGPTALIAAMRAIVAAELGDEVDIPEDFL